MARRSQVASRLVLLVAATTLTAVNLLVVGMPFDLTTALLSDTAPVPSNTFSTAACFPDWMYVWNIAFDSKIKGGGSIHDERFTVTVRQDSDTDCIAEGTDSGVTNASVTVELRDAGGAVVGTKNGTTGAQGTYITGWFRDLADGTYYAMVTVLSHSTFNWNASLDVVNPASHTIPHKQALRHLRRSNAADQADTSTQLAWSSQPDLARGGAHQVKLGPPGSSQSTLI